MGHGVPERSEELKDFKTLDLTIQAVLILAALIVDLIWQHSGSIIVSYLVVGGWQIMSMVVHWVEHYDLRRWSHRTVHTASMVALVLLAILGIMHSQLIILLLMGLLVGAPLLAIWYFLLCFLELKQLNRRDGAVS